MQVNAVFFAAYWRLSQRESFFKYSKPARETGGSLLQNYFYLRDKLFPFRKKKCLKFHRKPFNNPFTQGFNNLEIF